MKQERLIKLKFYFSIAILLFLLGFSSGQALAETRIGVVSFEGHDVYGNPLYSLNVSDGTYFALPKPNDPNYLHFLDNAVIGKHLVKIQGNVRWGEEGNGEFLHPIRYSNYR